MIAMQYQIILPADYPMESIEARIRDKGHLLDNYPGLLFKAYLYAKKASAYPHSAVNSYAPFYVWRDHAAMKSFLESEGFKGLCEQFGRPAIKMWLVDGMPNHPQRQHAFAYLRRQAHSGDVHAVDVTNWTRITLNWLTSAHEIPAGNEGELFQIGYVATSENAFHADGE